MRLSCDHAASLLAQCWLMRVGYFLLKTQERFATPRTVPCSAEEERTRGTQGSVSSAGGPFPAQALSAVYNLLASRANSMSKRSKAERASWSGFMSPAS